MNGKYGLGATASEEEDDYILEGIKRLAAWYRSPNCDDAKWKHEAREFILLADETARGLQVDSDALFHYVMGFPEIEKDKST